jgi:hypothetical protein
LTKLPSALLPDFENITYLKSGSPIQQRAYAFLKQSKILYHLKPFRPILTGTLPLDIFIEGKSDLDIICQASSFESVEKILLKNYGRQELFSTEQKWFDGVHTLLCRFKFGSFPIEIFCQPREIKEQLAYRHMVIEYTLLKEKGPLFKTRIIEWKKKGLKTEPAFAYELGLTGDPYQTLLRLENSKPT